MKGLTQKNIKITFLVVLLTNLCVDDEFTKEIVVCRGENAVLNLLKRFLQSMNTVKK